MPRKIGKLFYDGALRASTVLASRKQASVWMKQQVDMVHTKDRCYLYFEMPSFGKKHSEKVA